MEFIISQIIKPFKTLSDEDKKVFQEYYNKLLSLAPDAALANNIVEIDKYISKLAELLHMDENQLAIGFGYDLEADKQKIETVKARMGYIAEPKNSSDAYKNKVINDVISTLDKDDVELLTNVDISEESKNWTKEELVNSYFKLKELSPVSNEIASLQKDLSVVFVQVNNMENMMQEQSEILESVVDNMTISTRQQEKILRAGRNRVNQLLGGAHSEEYKRMGRTYLVNLWNNFKEDLHCGSSYKDLNPKDFSKALDYIDTWQYQEV